VTRGTLAQRTVNPAAIPHPALRESDEAVVARLAQRDENALRELHRRYAALVFSVAARFVGAATAEEVVQDVFVALWGKYASFDPARGPFKPWLLQIARRQALNRLRRGKALGRVQEDTVDDIASEDALPDESQWRAHRQDVIRAAVDALPEAQRKALSLAFFEELTHEQIAKVLGTPVGTAKTRIRLAMKRLAPALLLALGAAVLVFFVRRRDAEQRDQREQEAARSQDALKKVTASDVVPLYLAPTSAAPPEAHGNYRARPGGRVAVLTTNHLSPLAAPDGYVAWARSTRGWRRLGPIAIDADGRSLLVVPVDAGEPPPLEITVTRESAVPGDAPNAAPKGLALLHWEEASP
jgi:RNA polymerase sigma-70 factor (ECF subfamily)